MKLTPEQQRAVREVKIIDGERAWIAWAKREPRFWRTLFVSSRLYVGNLWRRVRGAPW